MRLHLVSLALLLLALCRPSSSTIYSDTSADTKSTISHDDQYKEGKALLLKDANTALTPVDYKKLDEVIGNSLYFLILKKLQKYEKLPEFYKKALVNGVLCELADPNTITNFNTALYGSATPAPDKRKDKEGIDCASAPDKCLCGDTSTSPITPETPKILCAVKKDPEITGSPGLCLKEARAALEKVAPTYGGVELTDQAKAGAKITSDQVPISDAEAKIFCEASSDKAEAAIKAVYAADATLWTMDAIISVGVGAALTSQYGLTADHAGDSCQDEAFKSSPFGQCVCSLDKGILLFCYPHVMGKKLQELGYLECTVEAEATKPDGGKFSTDAAKKPAKLPEIMPPKPDVTKTPGNETATTTEPSSAATSSLLLAAAVVLLVE